MNSTPDRVSCGAVVIGAGVLGLAIARELARAGHETVILERNRHIGMETSSRNSEIIHAGLYYPTGSLKARHCVRGRELLYAFCAHHGVAAPMLGKMILATSSEQEITLEAIKAQAEANGVGDLKFLSRDEAVRFEPEITFHAALLSPSTGIIDSHQLMLALLGEATDRGVILALGAEATHVSRSASARFAIEVRQGGQTTILETFLLVNSAGLWAPALASRIEGLRPDRVPKARFAKGNYVRLTRGSPFRRPIYPVPEPGGLGVHATVDLAGQTRFGPDVEWLTVTDPSLIDLAVGETVPGRFAERIRSYWPAVRAEHLAPDYSGVRPKLSGPGETAADFRIDRPSAHGIVGLINLFGIESPGLTAALSIAEEVSSDIERG